jgi:aryl-alcohol dehydrogenase-like predicted oxidoreductase
MPSGEGRLRVGLGAMPLSTLGRPDRVQAVSTVHAALDAGVRMIDTADAYCLSAEDTGHNESLIAEAISSWRGPTDAVVIATKGGHARDANGGWQTNGSPGHLAAAARASRQRLGVPSIPLYYFHRPDPATPFIESVGALATLLEDDVVQTVGLSNVDVPQLDAAAGVVPIGAVQNSFSPHDSSSLPVVEWCTERSIPFVAWAPLGGAQRAASLGSDRATAGHARVAATRGVSVARVVLAWVLAFSPVMLVIPGARRSASIIDAVAAGSLELTADELDELNESFTRG